MLEKIEECNLERKIMNIAFIPVRGGSKSIPLKNIKQICGKPLVYWTVKAACECCYIDKVYVATDSKKICDAINSFKLEDCGLFNKVEVIGRSAESASDTASTEFVMLEFAQKYEFDNIVLVQATSPMLTADDLNGGFELFNDEDVDSVLSCVRQYRFLWKQDEEGNVKPSNYNVYNRPRRQEFDGYLMENGAFYITSKESMLKYNNRISGRIKAYEMNEDTAFEIDEPSDWIIIESLMKKNGFEEKSSSKSAKVKMFLTDCDGCLTDGGMYYSENGNELKKFNTKDGMGFTLLKERGIITGIITGEDTKLVERRAAKLKIDELHQGVKDKLGVVRQLAKKYDISLAEIAYIGDDINDIEVLENVGVPCTVNNASESIKSRARYISILNGGEGAVREIIEKILKSNNEGE